jgi:hypothetical protein
VRSNLGEPLLAAALGGLLGFMALWLREMGWIFSGAIALVLVAFYILRNRRASVGWLLIAAGAVPAMIVGQNGVEAVLDPSIEVGVDTWVMLAVALAVASAGGLVLYLAATNRMPPRRHP